jgi:hypothetical protein
MTQQYIAGQFSLLLAELQPVSGVWRRRVDALRSDVEHAPLARLPDLAFEAMALTDRICWTALERGDMGDFCGVATTAVALADFAVNAGLVPE